MSFMHAFTNGKPLLDPTMHIPLTPMVILILLTAAAGPAFGACTISPRINTAEAIVGDLQRSGCKNGDIATVTNLPADAAAPLIRRVCAFNQQIVVIPREPRPPGSLVDLVCIYSPR
jgi:hypothetical protein